MFDHGVLESSRTDGFTKWLIAHQDEIFDPNSTSGNVECETGWFGVAHVSVTDIMRYVSEEGDPWMSAARNFKAGVFIVSQNNDGLVFLYRYDNEAHLDRDWTDAEDVYGAWLDEEYHCD